MLIKKSNIRAKKNPILKPLQMWAIWIDRLSSPLFNANSFNFKIPKFWMVEFVEEKLNSKDSLANMEFEFS